MGWGGALDCDGSFVVCGFWREMQPVVVAVVMLLQAVCINSLVLRSPITPERCGPMTMVAAQASSDAPPLVWTEEPDNTWRWKDYTINYIAAGPETSQEPILLIHGFGASVGPADSSLTADAHAGLN